MSRLVQDLLPEVAEKAVDFVSQCEQAGIPVFITATFRSYNEQNELYAQGRTQPGKVVTKAKGGESWHNFARAFDVVPIGVDGKLNWNEKDPAWRKMGAIGESLGLEWGGSWQFKDYPHFQLTGGLTLAEARAAWEKAHL